MHLLLAPLIAAAAPPAASAAAPQAPPEPQASIPFVNYDSIRTFKVVGRDTVYLQDRRRRWYRADLMGICPRLQFERAIGVETWGTNSLDRYGALIVEGRRCRIESLVRSGPPPKKTDE
jgi:hypothetical protein